MYVGGEKSEIRRVNVDTLNGFFINDLLRDIGYTMINECYWLVPRMELNGGLKLLRSDKNIIEMYEAALRNDSRICVYTEHPISLPEVVEEGDGNVASPSKGRKKICAKKTLTPRKKKVTKMANTTDHPKAQPTTQSGTRPNSQLNQQPNIQPNAQPKTQARTSLSQGKNFLSQPTSTMRQSSNPIQQQEVTNTLNSQHNSSSQPFHAAPTTTPEILTQYIPQAYNEPQSEPYDVHDSDSITQPQPPPSSSQNAEHNQGPSQHEVREAAKKQNRRSTSRPEPTGQTFKQNPDPKKAPSIFVPVDEAEEYSDPEPGLHCYESEELQSCADSDEEQSEVFPQGNADTPVGQVRLEVGMEFESLEQFKKAPVPSQEYWQQLDTIPILPPHYKRLIGWPTKKRDTSRDAPKVNPDPYRTKRKYGQIKCKYCLEEGHNSRSCKAKKEAMVAAATAADATAHGQNSSAATTAHVPPANVAQDEDDERLAEMYWEETLEDAEAEAALDAAAAEFEASLGVGTQPQTTTTLNPSPNMPHTPQAPHQLGHQPQK
ncbi:hypothetical protein Ahy_A07g032087 [Arachis hypogaea]|uniref:PB1-like domain-containing protein n=1 Tax=Arachis hypogaea TaxID=3818 RepID=A0A445C5Z8_ARAHY|nr:hypothetical protein Ahy_A07g032087 [Arachis hypogaea]